MYDAVTLDWPVKIGDDMTLYTVFPSNVAASREQIMPNTPHIP